MKTLVRKLLLALPCSAIVAIALAQEAPTPTPTVAPAPTEIAKDPAPAPAPAPVEPNSTVAPTPAPALHEIGAVQSSDDHSRQAIARKHHRGRVEPIVQIWGDATLEEGMEAEAVVSVFGSSTVDGDASDAAVSVGGDTTVNGSVGQAAVSVMGDTTVKGTVGEDAVAVMGDVRVEGEVHGQVVAVMGDVILGPKAVVHGQIVSVGGTLHKDKQAVVEGSVQQVSFPKFSGLRSWFRHCLITGRPLALASHLGWAWVIACGFLGLYLFLTAVVPNAIVRCAETLEQRPGRTVLTALLSALLAPLALVILSITVIGPIVFVVAMIAGGVCGRAAFLNWVGRRFAPLTGVRSAVLDTLIGGILVTLLYLVPVLGFLVWAFIGFLGLGMVVYTVILSSRREKPAGPPPTAPIAPAAPVAPMAPSSEAAPADTVVQPATNVESAPAGAGLGVASIGVAAASSANLPPPGARVLPSLPPLVALPASSLPRAGFGIRLLASLLDIVTVAIAAGVLHGSHYDVLWFAAYCVVMWTTKATTIGGIICGLKVVRLDDRKLDWSVALVRCLGGFLSLAVAGLGFFWVAIDEAQQSWHDKIAGTVVVRVPKGQPLV